MKKKCDIKCHMLSRIEQAENFTLKIGGELGDLCRIAKINAEKIEAIRKDLSRLKKLIGGNCGK